MLKLIYLPPISTWNTNVDTLLQKKKVYYQFDSSGLVMTDDDNQKTLRELED